MVDNASGCSRITLGGSAEVSEKPEDRESTFFETLRRGLLLFVLGLLLILFSEWSMTGLWSTAVKEIGFALIVSVIVWSIFENRISAEAETVWDRRIERVTNNVFQAVLRKDLPKPLIDEAHNLVLNGSAIRRNFSVTYTLQDHKIDSGDPCLEAVLVMAVMEFEMVNVSSDVFDFKVNLSLPNPVHPELKKLLKVNSAVVKKGGVPLDLDLEKAKKDFAEALKTDGKTHIPYSAGTVTLNPQETCFVTFSYVMVKEAEDSELLQTLYPADGLRITVFDAGAPGIRSLYATAVHRHELEQTESSSDPSAKIFKVSGYLLPHQGVLIWWKKRRLLDNGALPCQPAAVKAAKLKRSET